MTVQECYNAIGGDYQDALRRLGADERIKKFLLMFIKDHNFSDLKTALAQDDYEAAFMAAHTIKGIALNLGLTTLAAVDSELTEILRHQRQTENLTALFRQVEANYKQIYQSVNELLELPEEGGGAFAEKAQDSHC